MSFEPSRNISASARRATSQQPEYQLTLGQRDLRLKKAQMAKDALALGAQVAGHAAENVAEKSKGLFGWIGDFFKPVADFSKKIWNGLVDAVTHPQITYDRLVTGASHEAFKTIEDVYDPSDVNNPSTEDKAEATRLYNANRQAESSARERLSAAEKALYDALAAQVAEAPLAKRGLQKLLLDDKLGGKDLKGEKSLLAHLDGLSKQAVAAGIDQKALLQQVVAEVENPVRIAQHGKGTCGATTAQIVLVRANPAEYVRLIAGLASPAGAVKAVGGANLNRKDDWNVDNDNGRSISCRLFQPAVMEEGQLLGFLNYDNSEDASKLGPISFGEGLTSTGLEGALEQLTGKPYDTSGTFHWNRDKVYEGLKKDLAAGKGSVPVSLAWNDSGHFVQVDKIENGKVTYTNPWGLVQAMDEAEFKAHLTSVIAQK